MDAPLHAAATRALYAALVENGPLPNAAKEAAALCDGCVAARPASGARALVPPLCDAARDAGARAASRAWALRLLGGCVRRAGGPVLAAHGDALRAAVRGAALADDGRAGAREGEGFAATHEMAKAARKCARQALRGCLDPALPPELLRAACGAARDAARADEAAAATAAATADAARPPLVPRAAWEGGGRARRGAAGHGSWSS